jgi:hypothetical protein
MSGPEQHGKSSEAISDFVKTRCATCAAGWTRTGTDGLKVLKVHICLLDREPVWPQMTDCDRYEKREDSAPEPDR